MTLSQAWQSSASIAEVHWLLTRLVVGCLELAVLAIIAAILLQLFRPRTPRLAALVWTLVLAKPLLTLAIGSPIRVLQLSVPNASDISVSNAIKSPVLPGGDASSRVAALHPPAEPGANWPSSKSVGFQMPAPGTAGVRGGGMAAELDSLENGDGGPAIAKKAPAGWLASSWPTSLVAIWLSGVAMMLLRALWVRKQLAQMFHGCQVPDRALGEFYSTIAAALQIHHPPRLRVTDALESPALVGSWRATILIPAWLGSQADRSALAWSLRHELTHWKHGDLWLIRLRELAQAIFYFHPAAWFAGRRLELAIEIACDRAVISTDAEAADYAQRLYQILEAVRHRRRPALASGLFATRSQIARRLVTLVESPLRLRPRLSKAATIGIVILASIVLTFGIGLRHDSNAQEGLSKPPSADAQSEKTGISAIDANASAPKVEPEIKVTDVELLAGKQAGEMDLLFKVDAPAGRRFYLEYTHRKVRGAFAMTQVWESTGKVASIEMKLAYFPEFQGDRTVNVLESNAERLRCDINAKDCKGNSGVTTIIGAPLLNLPADQRYLTLGASPSDWAAVTKFAGKNARRVLLVCPKPPEGEKLSDEDADKIEPRSELIVGFYDEPIPARRPIVTPAPSTVQVNGVDIRTAHIKYRSIRTGSTTLAELSQDEVKQILTEADLDRHPENFAAAAAKLFAPQKVRNPIAASGEFFMAGAKRRDVSPIGWTRVIDDNWDLRDDPRNRQIDVHRKGESVVASLSLGSFLGRGRAGTEKYALKKYAGGIEIPTLTVLTRFVDGKLASLDMLMVDSAEFNEPIEEKEFALSAKAGTHVFIYYKNDQVTQPRFVPVPNDVPDLLAYLMEKGFLNDEVSEAKDRAKPAANRGIDLVVQRAGGKSNLNNGLPEELGEKLSRVPGVKQVTGGLLDTVSFKDANVLGALLNGWPPHSPLFARLKVQFGGRTLIAGDERKAMIGKGLADKLGKQVGDKIELYQTEQFEIVGIYESPNQFENNGLVVPLGELQRMMNRPGEVTGFTIVAEQPIDAKGLEDLRQRIQAVQPGLEVTLTTAAAVQPAGRK